MKILKNTVTKTQPNRSSLPLRLLSVSVGAVLFAALPVAQLAAQGINLGDKATSAPQNPTVDSNEVDVVNGQPTYNKLELQIGGNGIGALQFIRYLWKGATNLDNDYFLSQQYLRLPVMSATFGQLSETFYSWTPRNPTGSTIFSNVYTTKDGTSVSFTHPDITWNDGVGDSTEHDLADYIQYRNGVIWTFHYLDTQRLVSGIMMPMHRVQSVTSNTGYQLKFYYSSDASPTDDNSESAWRQLVKVVGINNAYEYCDPNVNSCALSTPWPQVLYSYTSPTLTVTDPAGGQTIYSGTSIRFPGSTSNDISYTTQSIPNPCPPVTWPPPGCLSTDRVVSATVGGKTTAYSYAFNSSSNTWTVTASGPNSELNIYTSPLFIDGDLDVPPDANANQIGPVTVHRDPLNRTFTYAYQPGAQPGMVSSNLTSVTLPEGNIYQFTRDSAGNVTEARLKAKPGSGQADLVSSQTIGPFGQPLTITDPLGSVTTYTYDPTHGGVLTETGPVGASGVRPVKRYAYSQRYAWFKNASGAYVQAASPVWVRTEERTCKATATVNNACAGGAADEIITAFDYGPNSGPNNLQLRGKIVTADGLSLRTCYTYDIYGNKISETSPRAGLTSCP
jgi:YD repeat-containing protein